MRFQKSLCAGLIGLVFHAYAQAQFYELDGVEAQYISDYLARAAAPDSGYDPLVAAMVAKSHGHDSLPLFLSQSYSDNTRERLRLSLIIEYCADGSTYAFCDAAATERLIAIDGDNFIPYLIAASSLLHQENEGEALALIEAGLKAATVNDYYLEKQALVRSELPARDYPANRVNMAGEGYPGPAYLYGFYEYFLNPCRTKPQQSEAWKRACFDMGVKLEALGKSWGNTVFGSSIQRDVLQNTDPQSPALPAILARRESYNTIRIDAAAVNPWWDDATRATVPGSFYQDSIEFGELKAIENALERGRAQTRNEQ